MIKWPIKYTNYNDEEVEENFYFNLNKAELTKMQLDANGAYSAFIERISNQRDKSDDGRLFRKSQELRDEFESTEAYAELYVELLSDAEKATKFVRGILPKDLQGAPIPENLRLT